MPFCTAREFTIPTLTAGGETPMGAAILQAIDAVAERKRMYKQEWSALLPALDFPDHGRGPDGRLEAGSRKGEGRRVE